VVLGATAQEPLDVSANQQQSIAVAAGFQAPTPHPSAHGLRRPGRKLGGFAYGDQVYYTMSSGHGVTLQHRSARMQKAASPASTAGDTRARCTDLKRVMGGALPLAVWGRWWL